MTEKLKNHSKYFPGVITGIQVVKNNWPKIGTAIAIVGETLAGGLNFTAEDLTAINNIVIEPISSSAVSVPRPTDPEEASSSKIKGKEKILGPTAESLDIEKLELHPRITKVIEKDVILINEFIAE